MVVGIAGQRREGGGQAVEGRNLRAIAFHAADIVQRRRNALDRGADRIGQQAVREVDIVTGRRQLQPAGAVADAALGRLRLFGAHGARDRIERRLADRERRSRRRRDEGAHILGIAGEDFRLVAQVQHRPDLRQEPVLALDPAPCQRPRQRVRLVANPHALPAAIDGQLADVERVADRILQRLGVVLAVPDGRHRITLEVQRAAVRRRGVGHAIEATRLMQRVALIPAGQLQLVGAGGQRQLGDRARAVEAVLGGAERQRRGVGDRRPVGIGRARYRRAIGRDPRTLPLVMVVIAGRGQRQRLGQLGREGHAAQIIAAQARRVIIAVVQRDAARQADADPGIGRREAGQRTIVGARIGRRRRAVGRLLGVEDRERIIVGDIVVIIAPTLDDIEAQILIVVLATIREVEEAGDRSPVAEVLHDLGIGLMLALAAETLPLVGGQIGIAQIALQAAAQIAAVGADEGADGIVAAIGARRGERGGVRRHPAGELDGAAQIAGRRGAQRARALRDAGRGDILGDDRAADVQAIGRAIAHVAQRYAVEREA